MFRWIADIFMSDRLHLNGTGAAVFVDELSAAFDSCMCSIDDIFGSKHCLSLVHKGYLQVPQTGQ